MVSEGAPKRSATQAPSSPVLRPPGPCVRPNARTSSTCSPARDLLSIPSRLLDHMSTLVVLPLLRDEKTSRVVQQALDELVVADNIPGSALLFLQGIIRLRVYDQVRGCAWLVSRRKQETSCRLANGATIRSICTTSARVDAGEISRTNAEWWQIRRRFGREGDNTSSRSDEAARIEAAVTRLPVGLRDVRTAYAAVALPRSLKNQASPKAFPVVGRMCIGLPSRMTTGTPAWLDGPFHGNVARTNIDLEPDSQPYTRLIFDECLTLFWQAVEHVKAVGGMGDRRGVLLWFDSEQGALTTHFESENMLSSANIILARSGGGFLAAGQLRLPEEIDGDRFESLFGHVPNLERFGFHLPDPWLLREGRKIIDSLTHRQILD